MSAPSNWKEGKIVTVIRCGNCQYEFADEEKLGDHVCDPDAVANHIEYLELELAQARSNYDSAVHGRREMREGLKFWLERAKAAERQVAETEKIRETTFKQGQLQGMERAAEICKQRAEMKAYNVHGDAAIRYSQDKTTSWKLFYSINNERDKLAQEES